MEEIGTVVASDGGLRVRLGYPGANATAVTVDGNTVGLAPDLRDAGEDWLFYWNACIESDERRSVTVSVSRDVVGPWGPAVSRDRRDWSWLGTDSTDDRSRFRYSFDAGERAYFAFAIPYVPADFERFWSDVDGDVIAGQDGGTARVGVERTVLTTTEEGRDVPLVRVGDPTAATQVVVTARHHACESPASFVLEGLLAELVGDPPGSWCAHVVPFVDLDGVQRGDQGKERLPHDHNRDYAGTNGVVEDVEPIYETTAAIKQYVRGLAGTLAVALDCHSPFKWGDPHDRVFFACAPSAATAADRRFAEDLDRASESGRDSLRFIASDGFAEPGGRGGNATFTAFVERRGATVSRALEIPYFGTDEGRVTPERYRDLGRAVGRATRKYVTDAID